jgi:hypothetical protein
MSQKAVMMRHYLRLAQRQPTLHDEGGQKDDGVNPSIMKARPGLHKQSKTLHYVGW